MTTDNLKAEWEQVFPEESREIVRTEENAARVLPNDHYTYGVNLLEFVGENATAIDSLRRTLDAEHATGESIDIGHLLADDEVAVDAPAAEEAVLGFQGSAETTLTISLAAIADRLAGQGSNVLRVMLRPFLEGYSGYPPFATMTAEQGGKTLRATAGISLDNPSSFTWELDGAEDVVLTINSTTRGSRARINYTLTDLEVQVIGALYRKTLQIAMGEVNSAVSELSAEIEENTATIAGHTAALTRIEGQLAAPPVQAVQQLTDKQFNRLLALEGAMEVSGADATYWRANSTLTNAAHSGDFLRNRPNEDLGDGRYPNGQAKQELPGGGVGFTATGANLYTIGNGRRGVNIVSGGALGVNPGIVGQSEPIEFADDTNPNCVVGCDFTIERQTGGEHPFLAVGHADDDNNTALLFIDAQNRLNWRSKDTDERTYERPYSIKDYTRDTAPTDRAGLGYEAFLENVGEVAFKIAATGERVITIHLWANDAEVGEAVVRLNIANLDPDIAETIHDLDIEGHSVHVGIRYHGNSGTVFQGENQALVIRLTQVLEANNEGTTPDHLIITSERELTETITVPATFTPHHLHQFSIRQFQRLVVLMGESATGTLTFQVGILTGIDDFDVSEVVDTDIQTGYFDFSDVRLGGDVVVYDILRASQLFPSAIAAGDLPDDFVMMKLGNNLPAFGLVERREIHATDLRVNVPIKERRRSLLADLATNNANRFTLPAGITFNRLELLVDDVSNGEIAQATLSAEALEAWLDSDITHPLRVQRSVDLVKHADREIEIAGITTARAEDGSFLIGSDIILVADLVGVADE